MGIIYHHLELDIEELCDLELGVVPENGDV